MDFKNASWPDDRKVLLRYLNSLSNTKYRDFSKKLIPGDVYMLGVNLPTLKKIAKEIAKGDYERFLKTDDGGLFEFKYLKGQVIASIKDVDEYERYFWRYLPSITDWSLCDGFIASSKIIREHKEKFFDIAKGLIESSDEFEMRVGFVILLDHLVCEEYVDRIFRLIRGFESEFYYANMALAWLICELYIKYPKETQSFLSSKPISLEVLKMSERKIKDSYRVSVQDKEWLKKLR